MTDHLFELNLFSGVFPLGSRLYVERNVNFLGQQLWLMHFLSTCSQ